jgi:hypothetical protein
MFTELKGCSVNCCQLSHAIGVLLECLWWFAASACSLLPGHAYADD